MDAIYTGLAWTPPLALATAATLSVLTGLMYVEAYFRATSYIL